MESSVQPEDIHSHWCANRSTASALGFVAFCFLGLILSWRVLGRNIAANNTSHLVADMIVIAVLAQVFAKFTCLRERLVLGLLIIRFGIGLALGLPAFANQVGGDLWKHVSECLWIVALIVSFTMLYSSFRLRRRVITYRRE